MRILIYGYGNPGRQDDGLGILLAEHIGRWAQKNNHSCISTDTNYQLNIEDAERISCFDLVVFCDSSVSDIDRVLLEKIVPDLKIDFSMHAVTPSFVLALCHTIFNCQPSAYQLHIKGYTWEFMQSITPEAEKNLKHAQQLLIEFLVEKITETDNKLP